jgi:hypothetical protein
MRIVFLKCLLVTGDIPIGENILKICEIMKSASITSSSNKVIFKAKPKLKVLVLCGLSSLSAFLPSFSLVSVGFQLLMVFHYLSKFYILILSLRETKTKDMKLFHKLVRNNRKKGTDTITELTANGNDYKGEENVVKAFQDQISGISPHSKIMLMNRARSFSISLPAKMICSIVIPVLHLNLVSSPIKGILEMFYLTTRCIPMDNLAWTNCVRSSAGNISYIDIFSSSNLQKY